MFPALVLIVPTHPDVAEGGDLVLDMIDSVTRCAEIDLRLCRLQVLPEHPRTHRRQRHPKGYGDAVLVAPYRHDVIPTAPKQLEALRYAPQLLLESPAGQTSVFRKHP